MENNNDNKQYWPIEKLHEWEKNPRGITKKGFERLKKQIQKLGQYKPLIITADGIVLGGNMRLKAYRDLGITQAWVSVVEPKDENQMLEYALSDNDRAGYYDEDLLANLLPNYNIDWSDFSIDLGEPVNLQRFLDNFKELEEDEQVDSITDPLSKPGELYQLGRHRLLCGDSTKREDVERLLNGQKADIIFTDPPYNVNYESSAGNSYGKGKYGENKIFNDNKSDDDFVRFLTDAITNAYAFSHEHANLYCWFALTNYTQFRTACENAGFKYSQTIIWLKEHFVMAFGQDFHRVYEPAMLMYKDFKSRYLNKTYVKETDVWDVDRLSFEERLDVWYAHRDDTNEYVHPTQKPVALAERALKRNSERNHNVLDLFGGSGSTLLACEQLERNCYMMELDVKYCDVIRKRYARSIGKEEQWLEVTPIVA